MRILIIEDDSMSQHILKGHLLQYKKGIAIVAWNKVDESKLELLEKHTPDVIILDYFLGRTSLTGYEFLRKIRKSKNPNLAKVPVIMTTSNTHSEDIKKILKLNVNAYLIKPIVKRNLYMELDKIQEVENAKEDKIA